MAIERTWIGILLYGIRRVLSGGTELPERGAINFIGATAVDNPSEDRTDVTIDGAAAVADATHLATASKIAKRAPDKSCYFGELGGTQFVLTEDVDVARVLDGAWAHTIGWSSQGPSGIPFNSSLEDVTSIPLDIPHGAVLTDVEILYDGSDEGRAAVPSVMPVVQVIKIAYATGAETAVDTETDGTTSPATFETPHAITVAGMTETIDRTAYRYRIGVKAEGGTLGVNAFTGAQLMGAKVWYTMPADAVLGLG